MKSAAIVAAGIRRTVRLPAAAPLSKERTSRPMYRAAGRKTGAMYGTSLDEEAVKKSRMNQNQL